MVFCMHCGTQRASGLYCPKCGGQNGAKSADADDVIITGVKERDAIRCGVCHMIKKKHQCPGTPCLSVDICGCPRLHKYPHQTPAVKEEKKRKAETELVREQESEREKEVKKAEEFIKSATDVVQKFDDYYKTELGRFKAAKLCQNLLSQVIANVNTNKRRKINEADLRLRDTAAVLVEHQNNHRSEKEKEEKKNEGEENKDATNERHGPNNNYLDSDLEDDDYYSLT